MRKLRAASAARRIELPPWERPRAGNRHRRTLYTGLPINAALMIRRAAWILCNAGRVLAVLEK